MAKLIRHFVDGRYGQVHLRIAQPKHPTKRPLVCLHMFPQSGRGFETLMPLLAKDRVVIAPDFPGYGESDGPDRQITAEDYAACIWEVVDDLALAGDSDTIDLFGIHAGAKLAVEATHQQPARVENLILCSAALLTDEEIEAYWQSLDKIPLDENGKRFREFWRMQSKYAGSSVQLEMVATAFSEMLRGGENYHWGHAAIFDYNKRFASRLSELSHPILLLNPGDDLYEMTPRTLPFIKNGKMLDRRDWEPGFLQVNASELARDIGDFLTTPETVEDII